MLQHNGSIYQSINRRYKPTVEQVKSLAKELKRQDYRDSHDQNATYMQLRDLSGR
jgi:hypothetical protein